MASPMPPSMRPPSVSDAEWQKMVENQLGRDLRRMHGEDDLTPEDRRIAYRKRRRAYDSESGTYRGEVVTRPTRDLNDDRVWTGGSRDFDERTGTNRPGHRGEQVKRDKLRHIKERDNYTGSNPWGPGEEPMDWDRKPVAREPMDWDRKGPPVAREPKREWWNEPKKEYRPEKSAKERRLELLTGGGGRRSSDTDRYSLLTGRGLSSNEDRMAMLTGRSDPPKEEWKSQYGGRREYDPQDREFNRQFNTEPTDNRDVRSWFPDSEPSRPVSKPSSFPDDVGPGKKYPFGKPDPSHPPGVLYSKGPGPAPNTNQGYDDSSVRERLKALEERPQSTGGDWQEDRIAALENRKPIVNQSTVDLSGVEGRISQLEGKGPSWQEDRVKQLEGSRSESKSARNLLDQRIASLENYYKNDPPPEESTGNRYEDKIANLNKMWEQQGSTWDTVKDTQRYTDSDDKRKWSQWGQDAWTKALPDPYVNQLRDLNREYNKPTRTAIIKGREYKSYGPRADKRLKDLDQWNIHEDQYLGTGTWKNQYDQDVQGWNRGYEDRYFASQSGLDKDSDEYKMRFRGLYPGWEEGQKWGSKTSDDVLKDIKERGYQSGKDYAWYQ